MNLAPTVSVVVICYNGERYLAKAIDSVLAQTRTDLELIVVDDGSSDGTPAVAGRYADPRLRYLHRENGGCSAARNTGIRASRGTWIAFLDSDDWWAPEKLAHQLDAAAANPDAKLIYSAAILVDEESGAGIPVPARVEGDVLADLLMSNAVVGSSSSAMVHRSALEAVGGFDERLRYAEDWECWLRISARFRVAKVASHDVCLLRRKGSHGSHAAELVEAQVTILDRAFTTYARHLRQSRRRALAGAWYMAVLNFNQNRAVRQERAALLQLIRLRPFFLESYYRLIRSFLPRPDISRGAFRPDQAAGTEASHVPQ